MASRVGDHDQILNKLTNANSIDKSFPIVNVFRISIGAKLNGIWRFWFGKWGQEMYYRKFISISSNPKKHKNV